MARCKGSFILRRDHSTQKLYQRRRIFYAAIVFVPCAISVLMALVEVEACVVASLTYFCRWILPGRGLAGGGELGSRHETNSRSFLPP